MSGRLHVSMFWSVAGLASALGCASPEDLDDDGDSGSAGSSPSVSGAAGGGAPSTGGSFSGGAPNFAGSVGVSGSPSNGGSAGTTAGASSGGAGSGGSSAGSTSTGGAGSSGAGSSLLFEDFEDGKADGWIADRSGDPADDDKVGDWAVVAEGSGRVYKQQTAYSDDSWAVGGDVSWTDQRVEAKVQFSTIPDDGCQIFLAARFQSADSYYFMYLRADGSLRVRKRFNGSTSDLVPTQDTDVAAVAGTWYTLALEAKGSTITAYLNGTVIGTAMDSDIKNGGVGVGVVDATAAFDDVRVTVP